MPTAAQRGGRTPPRSDVELPAGPPSPGPEPPLPGEPAANSPRLQPVPWRYSSLSAAPSGMPLMRSAPLLEGLNLAASVPSMGLVGDLAFPRAETWSFPLSAPVHIPHSSSFWHIPTVQQWGVPAPMCAEPALASYGHTPLLAHPQAVMPVVPVVPMTTPIPRDASPAPHQRWRSTSPMPAKPARYLSPSQSPSAASISARASAAGALGAQCCALGGAGGPSEPVAVRLQSSPCRVRRGPGAPETPPGLCGAGGQRSGRASASPLRGCAAWAAPALGRTAGAAPSASPGSTAPGHAPGVATPEPAGGHQRPLPGSRVLRGPGPAPRPAERGAARQLDKVRSMESVPLGTSSPKRLSPASTRVLINGRRAAGQGAAPRQGSERPAGPPRAPGRPEGAYGSLTVRDLKLELRNRGLDSVFCFSRDDLIDRLQESDGPWSTL